MARAKSTRAPDGGRVWEGAIWLRRKARCQPLPSASSTSSDPKSLAESITARKARAELVKKTRSSISQEYSFSRISLKSRVTLATGTRASRRLSWMPGIRAIWVGRNRSR
ncbi:MAG TPA: hypothetical protein DDW31_07400 [candidate division Zixibacteria bacterium]|nr:hypothetical protein [candidate division Zixibacteria bacterium]